MINDELCAWVKQCPDLRIGNGMNIKEVLNYQGFSLWWFFEFNFHCRTMEILEKRKESSEGGILRFLEILLGRQLFLIRSLFRFILGNLLTHKKNKNGEGKILIAVNSNWLPSPDPTLKNLKEDIVFGNIIRSLKNKWNIVALDQDVHTRVRAPIRTLFEEMKYDNCIWKPVETFLTFNIVKKAMEYSKKLEREWRQIRKNPDLIKLFNLNHKNIFKWLKDDFDLFFKYETFKSIFYIELMKRAIEVENPDIILISGEYSTPGKAAVIAGKQKELPTLALQHGIIHPYHIGYFHAPNEISNEISLQHCLIPDKTAVYGNYTKEVLTKICNYPDDAVVVTGHPRYDILARAKKVFCKREFLERHDLDPNKKTVLLITQYSSTSHKFLTAAVKALKELPDVQTVIKPHPGDTKPEWHKEVLKKENFTAVILNPNSNTFEAMFACDLMMTITSTVAIEAMFLNKPVVIINLTGKLDPMPYVESGAALGAYKAEDVLPIIRRALFGKKVAKKMEKNRITFVEYHLHDVGNATRNVIRLVEEMIAN